MAVKFHPLAKDAVEPDIISWIARARTPHFVKLGILQSDTPTVTVGSVTFVRLKGLVYRNQKARLVLGQKCCVSRGKKAEV